MRVLLPTHQLAAAGIGTVIEGLARSLPEALGSDELLLVGECPVGLNGSNVRCIGSPGLAGTRLGRLLYEQVGTGRAARTVDLVHLANPHALLLSSTPFVLTIHDVFFLDRPEWYPRSFVAFKRAMLAAVMAGGPRLIVCVSDYSRRALLAQYPERESDVRVVHPGVAAGGEFEPAAPTEPYFLTLATFEPRKNHLGLLQAFRRARERGLTLGWKVAGIEGYGSGEILAALREQPGVDVLGRVSNLERERLYRGALFFAFPSHAEGFGFPPLEAMVRGVPTICSQGSSMDETVGDAAIRVRSDDVEGWADALLRLAEDADERQRLRAAGAARAAEFTWPRTAAQYVGCYRDALELAAPDELVLAGTSAPRP